MNDYVYIIKACFGPGTRPKYITPKNSLSLSKSDAAHFASEKECEDTATQPFFESVMSFEFIPTALGE